MADVTGQGLGAFKRRFKDMGDGTYAEILASGGGIGASEVQGNGAAGVADSGNPVKVGGKYNAALPTLADGQRGDAQLDPNARLVIRTANASGLITGQNALSIAAEVVLAANGSRLFAEVTNDDATIKVYLGDDNTVTAANGHVLKPGASFSFEGYTGAIWAIAASGTPTVTFVEW